MKKFDKDKYLKNLKFKRNLTKYGKYFYIGVPCVLAVVAGIYFAYSKFTVSKDVEVVKTTVGEFIQGDIVVGAYIDGEYSKTIPGKNDGYIVDKIVCDNDTSASWDNDAWGIVLTNLTKRTKCNVYFETKKPSLTETITTAMSNNPSMFASDDPGNNIRYIGKDPSNYVYFNCSYYNNQSDSTCEKWRIIGVFNNVTKSDGTKENLVKIIRDESIGSYSWDYTSSGSSFNDWSNSTLQKLLNSGAYYNATTGTYYNRSVTPTNIDFTLIGLKNDITRNAIESVIWNLGGTSTYTSSSNGLASQWYDYERGTTVYSGHATTWTGKIGLMYSSDYGYATFGGSSTSRATCLAKELYAWNSLKDCYNNDYLFKSNYYYWTLVPRSGNANIAFLVRSDGFVDISGVDNIYGVHPVLYLKSSVSVVDGDGTSSNLYKLKM